MPNPIIRTEKNVEKIKDKVKIIELQLSKRISDLELSVGRLEERFKEIWELIPDLNDRTGEIEDLLNIVNLGIVDFKKSMEELHLRVGSIEELPSKLDKSILEQNEQIKAFAATVNKLNDDLKALSDAKEGISMKIDNAIMPTLNIVKESGEKNKISIDELKKELENFSYLVKSFQRTIELSDIDSVIKRFDLINSKILNLEVQIESLRGRVPDMSTIDKEMEIMKTKVQEMGNAVIDRDTRLKETEATVNIIKNKIQELKFVDTIDRLRSEIKEKERMVLINQMKIDELAAKFEKNSDDLSTKIGLIENVTRKAKHIDLIEAISKDVHDQVAYLDDTRSNVEKLSSKVEKIYFDMTRKMNNLEMLESELKKVKLAIFEIQKAMDEHRISAEVSGVKHVASFKDSEEIRNALNDLKKKIDELPVTDSSKLSVLENEISALKKMMIPAVYDAPSVNKDASLTGMKEIMNKLEMIDRRLNQLEMKSRGRPIILE